MAEATAFRGVITFLDELGVYDVVLPFLLVFTIVFAILEKTRVLGTEKVGDKELTKKNLDAMVAFVMAFLVIASTSLVRIINEVVANVVLVLILVISFLMLVGVFWGTGESKLDKDSPWMKFFMVLIFLAIVAILLNALGWLRLLIGIIALTPTTDWAATLVLLVIIIGVMAYVTREHSDGGGHGEKKKEGH
jgi:magnesium-transporting ATPase (P-type)